jgi:hypothetical protein
VDSRTRRRVVLRGLVQTALACQWVVAAVGVQAAAPTLEVSIKAAYLYKFTGFVEWPARAFEASGQAPIVIGVVGAPEVLDDLKKVLVGRSVRGRALEARSVAPGDPLEQVHMLYVRELDALPQSWIESAQAIPVLLVTDQPDGLSGGGMLNFLLKDGRVRFEASVPAAERVGIKLSARLLAVAERVVPSP